VGAGAEDNVLAAKPDNLGHSQSRLHGDEEKDVVPAAHPRASIGYRKKSLDLGPCQEVNPLTVVSFRRQRQDALREAAHVWLLEGHIAKKGMKGRQSDIAAAGGNTAFFLQMIEKRAEKRNIEILDEQRRRRLFQMLPGKR
jgi:hypothetical protein